MFYYSRPARVILQKHSQADVVSMWFSEQNLQPLLDDAFCESGERLAGEKEIYQIHLVRDSLAVQVVIQTSVIFRLVREKRAEILVVIITLRIIVNVKRQIASVFSVDYAERDIVSNIQLQTEPLVPVRTVGVEVGSLLAVEEEIAETVEDRFALVCFPSLRTVRMRTNDDISPIVDEVTIAANGLRERNVDVLNPIVRKDYQTVNLLFSLKNYVVNLQIVDISAAIAIMVRSAVKHPIVGSVGESQEADLHAMNLADLHRVSLIISASAKCHIADSRLGLQETLDAPVERMIVRKGEEIESQFSEEFRDIVILEETLIADFRERNVRFQRNLEIDNCKVARFDLRLQSVRDRYQA